MLGYGVSAILTFAFHKSSQMVERMSVLSLVLVLLVLCCLVVALFKMNCKLAKLVVWEILFVITNYCIVLKLINCADFAEWVIVAVFLIYTIVCLSASEVFEEEEE
jgi:hypothetical protein